MPNGDRGKASLEVTLASWWASDPRGSRIATRTASPPVAPGSPAGGKPPLTRGRSSSSWTAPAGSAPSKRGNCAPQSGVGSTCAERRDRGKVQRPLGQGQLDQQLRLAGSAGSGGKSLEGHGRGAYRGRSRRIGRRLPGGDTPGTADESGRGDGEPPEGHHARKLGNRGNHHRPPSPERKAPSTPTSSSALTAT